VIDFFILIDDFDLTVIGCKKTEKDVTKKVKIILILKDNFSHPLNPATFRLNCIKKSFQAIVSLVYNQGGFLL